ncbi:SRPBCC family protein [Caldithrix abyssi]|nr:SRPBCC family protein [Caldithrix abyssi]
MKGQFQGQDELIMNASVEKIWNILIDGTVLSTWMPIVKHTTSGVESLNAERSCDVEMNGKKGKVKEKCVLFNEKKEIGWLMLTDEFGIGKMFANYSFSFELVPISHNKTKVINKGYADPKNLFAKIINAVMLKSKGSKIRNQALNGIKNLAEL